MTGQPIYRRRLIANIRVRSIWAMVALLLTATIALAQIVLTLIVAFDRGRSEDLALLYLAVSFYFSVVAVVCLVLFVVWLYGAHANLGSFGRTSRFKPAATVFWWLVPIANLFMPYQVTADVQTEMVAVTTDDWESRDPVKWWWGALVFGFVVYLVSVQFETPPGAVSWPLIVETTAWCSLVVASYFGIRLIRRITALQTEY